MLNAQIVVDAIYSLIRIFLLCLAGYLLARCGILSTETRRQLIAVNLMVFTPCLLFSKVAFSLTPQKLKDLWVVPVTFSVITVTSLLTAWCLAIVSRAPTAHRGFMVAVAMFMNTDSLPVAVMQSLTPSLPRRRGDDEDTMVARAFTILMFHSTASALLRWSAGVYLLRSASQHEDRNPSYEKPPPPRPGPSSQDMQSLPTMETLRPVPTRARHALSRIFHQTRLVFTPPLCAAVLAIIVASVGPLQRGLEQHLKPVVLAVNDAGACSIPVTLVVLGAYFWKGRTQSQEGWSWRRWLRRPTRLLEAEDGADSERLLGRRRAVFLPIVARMVITPAILFPVSYILVAKRIAGFDDPVLVTSTVLVICSPPAISLAQMSYQAGSETFDELISSVLLWGYAFTPIVTLIAAVVGPTFADTAVKH